MNCGDKMTLTGELSRDISIADRPAAVFDLDRSNRILHFAQFGKFPLYNGPDDSSAGLLSFLPFGRQDIKAAVEAAFDQRPTQLRFAEVVGELEYSFDLYCFPGSEPNNISIRCFLIDRCRDEETAIKLQNRINGLDIINQAVRAFAETNNLTEILHIILLAVTSGPGLGFNRGFILLLDEARQFLHGCLATGPSSPREAGEIWRSLSAAPLSLADVLRLYRTGESSSDAYVNQLVTSLKIPVAAGSNFLTRAFEEKRGLAIGPGTILNDEEKMIKEKLGAESLAVAPLISRDNWLGVIIADNLITGKPFSSSDLKLLEIFARYASDAIDNTHLYGRLQRKIARLKEANEKAIRSRENLIRAEKWSSVSKMALEVSHEIRNPLTVIGGHANARLRKVVDDPENARIFGIISKQAARIENVLNRFSSIVSLGEKEDSSYKILELVEETLRTMISVENQAMPELFIDDNIRDGEIIIDQGLFDKAMMVIFKESALIAGGISRLRLRLKKQYDSVLILIGCDENGEDFAGKFFKAMRTRQRELNSQEFTVAFEILQHYGGDFGIGSPEGLKGWLAVEFPLIKEEK
jgi:GAF domain-containing protein